MLKITVPGTEFFDEDKNKFITKDEFVLELEHSLVSLSKWESRFEKPFLSSTDKTNEEALAYVEAMTLTPNVPPEVFSKLSNENLKQISEYVEAKSTATWFAKKVQKKSSSSSEVITAELVYYWMISYGIPLDPCQNWHLNRLFTLIEVFNAKNEPNKKTKMNQEDIVSRKRLNEQRRQQLKSRG